jgi:hypothetical protein
MVVEYKACPTFPDLGFSVCGVLRAGESHDEPEDGDRRLEAFLRAAEPPAHNTWSHTTRRIKADYPSGRWKALNALWESINNRVRDVSSPNVPTSGLRVPSALAKLLRIDTGGTTPPEGKLSLEVSESKFKDGVWEVKGSLSNSRPTASWNVQLGLRLDTEGGRPATLSVAEGTVNGTPTTSDGPRVRATVCESRAEFTLLSEQDTDLDNVISQAACVVVAKLVKQAN